MDNNPGIALDNLINDNKFNFLHQLNGFFGSTNDTSESPYGDCNIQCDYLNEEQFCSKYSNNGNVMLMSLNIQSLPSKFDEFNVFINDLLRNKCSPDVIALQELWQLNDPSIFKLNNYQNLTYKSRAAGSQGGGVGFYIRDNLKYIIRQDISIFIDKIIETLFIKINLSNGKNIIVGSIYRPNSATANVSNNEQLSIFNDNLMNILTIINDCGLKAYILGDINIDVLKIASHVPTSDYVENIFSAGFLQIVTNPTRCTYGSASLIDHILTNNIQDVYESGIITNRLSDHFPLFHVLSQSRPKPSPKVLCARDFSANNVANFNNSLHQLGWRDVLDCDDTQQSTNLFFTIFMDLFNLYFPLQKKKFNKNFHKKEKWMTNGLIISRLTKRRLCDTSIRIPTPENTALYKKFRNLYNRTLRLSKKLHFEHELYQHKTNLRKTWQTLRQAFSKNNDKLAIVESLITPNGPTEDPSQIADCFNLHFSTMAKKIVEKIVPTDRPPDLNHKIFNCSFNNANLPVSTMNF